jgi:hypothetical protein
MTDIATLRGMMIQQAIERMTMLFAANPGADEEWQADVRLAAATVQRDIALAAKSGDLSTLQALDVAAHSAWPAPPG